jgi:hypothetical protein
LTLGLVGSLINKEILAINIDVLGKLSERKINTICKDVFVRPLTNRDFAVAILKKRWQNTKC